MRIRTASAVALLSMLSLSSSAFAFDYDTMLRNFLSTKGNTSGATQDLIKTNINTRQAQLESEVQAGVNSGQVNPQEERELRSELNRIADMEGEYLSDRTLSNWEVESLLDEMANFSRRLQTYLTNNTTVGDSNWRNRDWYRRYIGRGPSGDYPSNQRMLQASIDTRQAEIDAKIDSSLRNGRMRWDDARNFRTELQRIASTEQGYLSDGRLSYGEASELERSLDNLKARVDTHVQTAWNRGRRHAGERQASNRHAATASFLRSRIQRGLNAGTLTRAEADRLLREERRIAELDAQLSASGGRLTFSEQRRLLAELDDLSRKINRELTDRQVQ